MEEKNELNKKIGLRIKSLRENLNEYQKETAQIITNMGEELSEGQLGLYELGMRKTPPNIIKALAIHFNVSSDYLLGITDSPNKPTKDDVLYATHINKDYTKLDKDEQEEIKKDVQDYADYVIKKYFNKKK